jgi:SARP family transcriptional regulator, regulator of embCAB operon
MYRVHLTGRVEIDGRDRQIREGSFPSRQALLVFVFLTAERARPVAASTLADLLWPDEQRPSAWETSLSAILSRLRALLRPLQPDLGINRRFGAVQLELPPGSWVDIEAAAAAVDDAEGHWRKQRNLEAWGSANVAVCIAREPLLPDYEGTWLQRRRSQLRDILRRGLMVLSNVSLGNREADLALLYAQQLVELDPLRESGYSQLMRVHAAVGNRGEALQVYARCRERLREELGASPSAETEAVFLDILRA